MNYNIKLPTDVNFILDTISKSGYDSYVVGGCVRDSLLGTIPHDWDITTSASPETIMSIFKDYKVIPTGLKHGTVTVVINDIPYEITTYRTDGIYVNHRKPESVMFTSNIVGDLSRRDFTINAIAYNPTCGLVDPFNGITDLRQGLIRCVNNPQVRFEEDALRILRAIRFSAQLKFSIEPNTSLQIHKLKQLLQYISYERINSEFSKMIITDSFVDVLSEYKDVFAVFIPELSYMFDFEQHNSYHDFNVFDHTLHALRHCESKDLITRLAILFHDIGKPHCYQDEPGIQNFRHFRGHAYVSSDICSKRLTKLRFDNETITKVSELVLYHDAIIEEGRKYVRRWLNKISSDQFVRLIDIKICDVKGQKNSIDEVRVQKLKNILSIYDQVTQDNECFSLKDLAVDGYDLMGSGIPEGKEIGKTLNRLLELVISDQCSNTKEDLLSFVFIDTIE